MDKKYRVELTVWCDVEAEDEREAERVAEDDLVGVFHNATKVTGTAVTDVGLASKCGW